MGSDVSERSADWHPDNETRDAAHPPARSDVPSAIDEIGQDARNSALVQLAGDPPAPATVEDEEGTAAPPAGIGRRVASHIHRRLPITSATASSTG